MLFNFLINQFRFLLFGLFAAFFASYGQTFFISIFNFQIRETLNLSNADFGLIYSLATILSSVLLIWFGKIIDYIDLRIYSLINSLGLAIACIGMFYLFDSISFLFIIIFSLRFFGQGAMCHTGITTLSRYYNHNRGKAISLGSFGFPMGEMVIPFIIVVVLTLLTWRYVWLLASLSILIFWIPLKQKPGIGTILNAIIIAIVFDYTLPYLPIPHDAKRNEWITYSSNG